MFGDDEWGAEVFTAWHYARFTESLVQTSKAEYDLPMFVNAALIRTGRKPRPMLASKSAIAVHAATATR